MNNQSLQLIYTYLTNYVKDKDIKELALYLQDYAVNGSLVDCDIADEDLEAIRKLLETIDRWEE